MPNKPKEINNEVSYIDSFGSLADIIEAKDIPIPMSTFDKFVQDVGRYSYPDYDFSPWHIRKICQWVDELMESENRVGVCALPRGHLKSTILGYLFSIYRFLTGFGDSLYISYKEDLATYHMSNIKTAINQNPILNKFCKDMIPQSNASIQYKIGSKIVRMYGSGIFAVKRGLHTNGVVIVDDVLGTVENPLVLTELEHAEHIFNQEIQPIPNRGCPMIVFGTVIDYSDLLFKLRENKQFMSLWLPAIDPDPDHEVLWDRYDKKILEKMKEKQGWKAFSTEYLLIPVIATNAYFSRDVLNKVINKELINFNVGQSNEGYWWKDSIIVAGFDIGQKGNPSHMSIFAIKYYDSLRKQKLIQIHQKFLDNWEYTRQIQYVESTFDFFRINRLYYDNTRGEFTDRTVRGSPIILGSRSGEMTKGKVELATNFSKLVEQDRVELLNDDRFISQILCVTNDLQAPNTVLGHGDAFISVMLAIGAFCDFYDTERNRKFSYLGDLQTMLDPNRPDTLLSLSPQNDPKKQHMIIGFQCPICNSKLFEVSEDGKKKCVRCSTKF